MESKQETKARDQRGSGTLVGTESLIKSFFFIVCVCSFVVVFFLVSVSVSVFLRCIPTIWAAYVVEVPFRILFRQNT